MDILNFISWIRGRRQVTTVDPAKTLIPLGIKDGRRDDEYLAGAITVEDLAAQVGGLQTVAVDGITITGDGTPGDPLVAAAPTPSYKVYTALLTQSGTTAPAAIVLENTLGTTVTFSYLYVGNYEITFGIVPNFVKTTFLASPLNADASNWFLFVNKYTFPTRIALTTRVNGVDTNNLLNSTFIEIRVYN
jgi:hypothetical protein